jgi:hypothetical protein
VKPKTVVLALEEHLVAAEVLVVEALQPAAQLLVVDLVGGGVGRLELLSTDSST